MDLRLGVGDRVLIPKVQVAVKSFEFAMRW